jgi:hypothetical protein
VRNANATRREQALRVIPVALLALGGASMAWNLFGSTLSRDWLPYGVAAALLTAGLLWSGSALRPPPLALGGLAALLGLAAWDALSLVWSPVPALARDEALLVLLYALSFLVPLLVLRAAPDRHAAVVAVTAILVALAFATLVELLVVEHPAEHYEGGRLTFPISYVNAQAAMFLLAFWPSVALAAGRAARPWLRTAAVGGACILLAGGLMTQSKGGLIASAVAGIALFAVSPDRLRLVIPALIPIALVGGSYELLTRPFREQDAGDFADAVRFASETALVLTGVALAAGALYVILDRRVTLSAAVRRIAAVGLSAALILVAVGAVAAFFVTVDRPGHYLADTWDSFKSIPERETGSSHLTSLGSNRYDFWRVELGLARDHPLAGVGARGFASEYLLTRRSDETPARGHSVVLDTLSETGVVGLALLAAALGLPVAAAVRRGRRDLLLAGTAAACVYGVVHAAGDWILTFPAVGVPFFALLGVANAGADDDDPAPTLRGRVATAGALLTLVAAFGAFGLPWLSARFTQSALDDPPHAASDLRWAKRLDPLAVDPYLAAATLAPGSEEAVAALRKAVSKQPKVSSLRYRLGLAELAVGRRDPARAELREAHRLDPRSTIVSAALARASSSP